MKVALIDYGAGNLHSVENCLRALEVEPQLVSSPAQLEGCTHLILPGVGSFGDCMEQLGSRGLIGPIREWVAAGKPYFGICLGYQILFDSSEESPGVDGLGLISGKVRRFAKQPGLKIPHMGWNAAKPTRPEEGLWRGLGEAPYFYFVHSYFPQPTEESVVAAQTEYGADRFAAAVEQGPVVACQFHPEKSQAAGVRLISNFLGI
ncbi:MAG: imidazole glycerol phosphate synthase subunit HisH [Akkermansiaceae bacterium]|nr:imidazole glycerol phosphate synthase subunit HisH [Akkermansiaceae bacterium]